MARSLYAGKLARRRTYKAGDMPHLLKMLWQALLEAEAVLLTSDEPELTLKACNAIGQVGATYAKLLEASEFVRRLETVERTLEGVPVWPMPNGSTGSNM